MAKYAVLALAVAVFPVTLFAATLNISPESGVTNVGKIYSVNIVVNSPNTEINAVSGELTFPKDTVAVTSVTHLNSIVSFWAQPPTFSNTDGKVHFEGIILSPGFKGTNGKVVTIYFKTKNVGTASFGITNASILANDGQGTSVLDGVGNGTLTIEPAQQVTVVPPNTIPVIASTTHPDSAKWYTLKDIHVVWDVPVGTNGVYVGINQNPDTIPVIKNSQTKSYFDLRNAHDGIWYAHLRFGNSAGGSQTTHFKIGIDTVAPETFTILAKNPTTDARGHITLQSNDVTSGIEKYSFILDGGQETFWTDSGSHEYVTDELLSDKHVLVARAYDFAGNYKEATLSFETQKLESKTQPVVTELGKQSTGAIVFEWFKEYWWLLLMGLSGFLLMVLLIKLIWHSGNNSRHGHFGTPLMRHTLGAEILIAEKLRKAEPLTDEEVYLLTRLKRNLKLIEDREK